MIIRNCSFGIVVGVSHRVIRACLSDPYENPLVVKAKPGQKRHVQQPWRDLRTQSYQKLVTVVHSNIWQFVMMGIDWYRCIVSNAIIYERYEVRVVWLMMVTNRTSQVDTWLKKWFPSFNAPSTLNSVRWFSLTNLHPSATAVAQTCHRTISGSKTKGQSYRRAEPSPSGVRHDATTELGELVN